MRWFLGIDPGVSGGLAVLAEHGAVVGVVKMPDTDTLLWHTIRAWANEGHGLTATIERTIPFSRPGAKIGVVSAFTSGRGYGRLLMALQAARVPYVEVMPIKWQNAMACRTGGDKNVSKTRAQALFPRVKVTHAIADALLIAEYGRHVAIGDFLPAQRR